MTGRKILKGGAGGLIGSGIVMVGVIQSVVVAAADVVDLVRRSGDTFEISPYL